MTGDLNLPPRHRLPANVHDRIRTTVLAGIRRPAPSWQNRARPPLAVAAGVAVLAVGVGIVVQSATEGPGGGPGPTRPPSSTLQPPPLDPAAAAVDLDRCWAQLQQSGKAGSVSARETWVPVFAVTEFGRTMTAARAAGKPLFCETTRTTVTVSDPNATPGYARGTSTAAMLVSADGGIGGVVGPDWRSMVFLTVAPSGASEQTEAFIKDGLFVDYQTTREQAPYLDWYYKKIGKPTKSHGNSYAQFWSDVQFQRMPNVSQLPGAKDLVWEDLISATDRGIAIIGDGSFSIDQQRYNAQFGGQVFYEIKGGKIVGMLKDVAYQMRTPDFWNAMDMIGGKKSYEMGASFFDGKGQPGQVNAVSHGCVPSRFRNINVINTGRKA